jgi:protein SCO1/2
MRGLALLPAILLVCGAPTVQAALTEADLAAVELSPPPGARLAAGLPLVDETGRAVTPAQLLGGRPAVLVFADYTCTFLCGTALGMAAASLEATRLRAGEDYTFAVLGLDPRDGPLEAAALKAARLGRSPLAATTRFLTGDAATLASVQATLGYTARYDAANDQYAHPLGALVLAADGRVSRVLGGIDLDPDTLRLGLVEASSGQLGSLGDRLRLLCYGFDGARGIYTAWVKRALTLGTAGTVLGLGLFLFLLNRRGRRA